MEIKFEELEEHCEFTFEIKIKVTITYLSNDILNFALQAAVFLFAVWTFEYGVLNKYLDLFKNIGLE